MANVNPTGNSAVQQLSQSSTDETKSSIQGTVDQKAQEVLSTSFPGEENKGWNVWSWLPWSNNATVTEEEKSAIEYEKAWASLGNGAEESEEEDEAQNKGWTQSFIDSAKAFVGSAATGTKNCAAKMLTGNLGDKVDLIAESKKIMLESTDDPQFVEFFEMLRGSAAGFIKEKIRESGNSLLANQAKKHQGLLIDCAEVNLALGFANLAKQVKAKAGQPTLVNILSLLSQKGSAHLNATQLSEIEKKYRESRESLAILKKKLFPNIDLKPTDQELTEEELTKQEQIRKTKEELLRKLIEEADEDSFKLLQIQKLIKEEEPDSADLPLLSELWVTPTDKEKSPENQKFLKIFRDLNERHIKLKELFSQLADDILPLLFPNKFKDMELPPVLRPFAEPLYDWLVKDAISDFLLKSYEPLENDETRNKEWKNDLETRLCIPDLKDVMNAPPTFVWALAKNFIQSDPNAASAAVWVLNKLQTNPSHITSGYGN